MCQDQKCESIKLPGNDCLTGCDNHGVCNSREHCHCDPGYAPPDCRGAGPGGSVDSNGGGQYPSMYFILTRCVPTFFFGFAGTTMTLHFRKTDKVVIPYIV